MTTNKKSIPKDNSSNLLRKSSNTTNKIGIKANNMSTYKKVNKLVEEYGLTFVYSEAMKELIKDGWDADTPIRKEVMNKNVALFISKLSHNAAVEYLIAIYEINEGILTHKDAVKVLTSKNVIKDDVASFASKLSRDAVAAYFKNISTSSVWNLDVLTTDRLMKNNVANFISKLARINELGREAAFEYFMAIDPTTVDILTSDEVLNNKDLIEIFSKIKRRGDIFACLKTIAETSNTVCIDK